MASQVTGESAMSHERLTELEIKIAYQEDTLKALNDVIYQQQKRIERLEAALLRCQVQLDNVLGGSLGHSITDEKPPHY